MALWLILIATWAATGTGFVGVCLWSARFGLFAKAPEETRS